MPYPSDPYTSFVTKVDSFAPGTFQFEWSEQDANGVYHKGTASGTWKDFVVCGGRGCVWHAPELLTFSVTVY